VITENNGNYAVQGRQLWYQLMAGIRLPISRWHQLSRLTPFPLQIIGQISVVYRVYLSLTHVFWVNP